MKKIKTKLRLEAETIRALSGAQLEKVAGGLPQSRPGSGCMSCQCQTLDMCPTDHATCGPSVCGGTCIWC